MSIFEHLIKHGIMHVAHELGKPKSSAPDIFSDTKIGFFNNSQKTIHLARLQRSNGEGWFKIEPGAVWTWALENPDTEGKRETIYMHARTASGETKWGLQKRFVARENLTSGAWPIKNADTQAEQDGKTMYVWGDNISNVSLTPDVYYIIEFKASDLRSGRYPMKRPKRITREQLLKEGRFSWL